MSLTLATVADALIEFILSLLKDPEVRAEFDEDPDHALAVRGLQHAAPSDVAAVAPVIMERTHVVHVASPAKTVYVERDHSSGHGPVVQQIREVTSHLQWVDDRDTIVDQSVNQNIWAEGDVTQTFDNEAVVASGDDAVAAGEDAAVDKTWDHSTTIDAGEDVNIGNDTDVETVNGSSNADTDASTTTDDSTHTVIEDSFGQHDQQVGVADSLNDTVTQTVTDTDATDITVVGDAPAADAAPDASSQDAAVGETQTEAPTEAAVQEAPVEEAAPVEAAPAEAPAEAPVEEAPQPIEVPKPAVDPVAQYVEADVAGEADDAFGALDAFPIEDGDDDGHF